MRGFHDFVIVVESTKILKFLYFKQKDLKR